MVLGMSRIAFAPAQTTATSVRANSSRSADTSQDFSAPRWTPPIPPVANTWIAAISAIIIVPATVVAPFPPNAISAGKSLRDALMGLREPFASETSSSRVKPTFSLPFIIAIVAGIAPSSRTAFSTFRAVSRFCGQGIPCVIIVDSRATTGIPVVIASATSSEISRYLFIYDSPFGLH